MPTQYTWSILCQKPVVDSQTNNINLLDVFEQISINIDKAMIPEPDRAGIETKPKAFPFNYALVTAWTKNASDAASKVDARIEILDPAGKKLKEENIAIEVPADKRRMRHITAFTHLFLTSSGNYLFRVSVKDKNTYKVVSELPLEVHILVK